MFFPFPMDPAGTLDLNTFFKCFFNRTTVERPKRVRKPKSPDSVAMLARPYDDNAPKSFACEPKIDGVRVIVTVSHDAKNVFLKTRNGKPLKSLEHLSGWFIKTCQQHGIHTFDCEAVAGSNFFDGVGRIRSSKPALDAALWLIDLPDHSGSYLDRREAMSRLAFSQSVRCVPSYQGMTPGEAFVRFTSEGFEGAMIKCTSSPYRKGIRSNDWLKVKDVDLADCRIISVHEGEGRFAGTLGHVVVSHNGKSVRVGGGFTDQQRKAIWKCPSDFIGSFVEVTFQQLTPDGSMRHPRVYAIRGDK